MYPLNPRTTYLFAKYYNKTATPQEIKELFYLFNKTSDDELLSLLRREWATLEVEEPLFDPGKSREIINQIISERTSLGGEEIKNNTVRRIHGFRKILALAAALIVVLGLGVYFYRGTGNENQQLMASVSEFNELAPGGSRAMLVLSDGQRILLDSLKNGLILRTSDFEINKTENGQIAYQTFSRNYKNSESLEMNAIYTPRGGEYRVILPDGSKVWLNAASSIKFPTVFRGSKREVELSGEAYFEVAKNALKPFRVKSRYAEIQVLGTHFNVRAYNDERAIKTTLVEGSVKVRSLKFNTVLHPGEQAVLQANIMSVVTNVDVEEQVAWKNGLFQFKDARLEDVLNQAALWYDLKIIYTGKIPQKQLTGKTSRKVNASEFLNMLKYIGVEFKREGKNVTITN